MDKEIEKQLLRQLKILNFWLASFGIIMLLGLGVIGFFLFQAFTFVKSAGDNFSSFQKTTNQTIQAKDQLCNSDSQLGQFLKTSGYC